MVKKIKKLTAMLNESRRCMNAFLPEVQRALNSIDSADVVRTCIASFRNIWFLTKRGLLRKTQSMKKWLSHLGERPSDTRLHFTSSRVSFFSSTSSRSKVTIITTRSPKCASICVTPVTHQPCLRGMLQIHGKGAFHPSSTKLDKSLPLFAELDIWDQIRELRILWLVK